MGMRENDRINVCGRDGQGAPIAQSQLLVALEQAAIDHQSLTIVLDQIFGTGDSTGPSQKCAVDAHRRSIPAFIEGDTALTA